MSPIDVHNLWNDYILLLATEEALAGAKFMINGEWHVPHSDHEVRRLSDNAIVDLFELNIDVTEIRTPITEVAHVGGRTSTKCL